MRSRAVTSRFAFLAMAFVLAAGACHSTTEPQLDLTSARARWASVAPAAYEITIVRSCECLPEAIGPVTVAVRNGIVESRRYTQSGAPVAGTFAEAFPTVAGLFALIDTGVHSGTLPLSAQFDPTFGYPVHVAIGDAAADAPEYTVTAFRPL